MAEHNGWSLVKKNPEVRKNMVQQVSQTHPDYVVIIIKGLDPLHCTKFLTKTNVNMGDFVTWVAKTFQYSHGFRVAFEGRIYPDDNIIGDIYNRQARDDAILYGTSYAL